MSDVREALVALIRGEYAKRPVDRYPTEDALADAILAEFDVTEPEWEYGVRWGDEPDDSRPAICDSRAHAESRAAASHGDRVVRRTPARTLPAGPWEVVEDD